MDAENAKETFEVEVLQQGMEGYEDIVVAAAATEAQITADEEGTINGNGNSPGRTEAEIENLTSSLLALTSRFAQVQFRVRQIVQSAPEECEKLVKELEKFVFTGVDDDEDDDDDNGDDDVVDGEEYGNNDIPSEDFQDDYYSKMGKIRLRQNQLIQRLREQLSQLQEVERNIEWRFGEEEKVDTGDEKTNINEIELSLDDDSE